MNGPYTQPEGVTDGYLATFGTPVGWWECDGVVIRGESQPELVYLLSGIGRSPLKVVDRRRRLLIEAFTALPLVRISDAIGDYWRSRKRRVDLFRAQSALRERAPELIGFIEVFGPVGVGWGAELALRGPSNAGLEPDRYAWYADFTHAGPGRFGVGVVKRTRLPAPTATLEDRLRSGDGLRGDSLEQLKVVQRELASATELARLILDQAAGESLREACRVAVGGGSSHRLTLDLSKSSPWRRAFTKSYPERSEIEPFGTDARHIRWREFAPLLLGELITRQLNWTHLRAEVLTDGRFARSVRPTSLVELMYMQLLERLETRRQRGITSCASCDGVLFRRRRRDALKGQEHHPGCGLAARVARHRAKSASDA